MGNKKERPDVEAGTDDFEAGTALENLRGDVEQIEALAHAAKAALENMPARSKDRDERRAMGRLYSLVEAVAETTAATLDKADEMVAQLGRRLAERRRT